MVNGLKIFNLRMKGNGQFEIRGKERNVRKEAQRRHQVKVSFVVLIAHITLMMNNDGNNQKKEKEEEDEMKISLNGDEENQEKNWPQEKERFVCPSLGMP